MCFRNFIPSPASLGFHSLWEICINTVEIVLYREYPISVRPHTSSRFCQAFLCPSATVVLPKKRRYFHPCHYLLQCSKSTLKNYTLESCDFVASILPYKTHSICRSAVVDIRVWAWGPVSVFEGWTEQNSCLSSAVLYECKDSWMRCWLNKSKQSL